MKFQRLVKDSADAAKMGGCKFEFRERWKFFDELKTFLSVHRTESRNWNRFQHRYSRKKKVWNSEVFKDVNSKYMW